MASIGLKRFRYAPLSLSTIENVVTETYGTPATLAGAIECNITVNKSEATLYCDDAIKESAAVFQSGTITLGIDEDDDEIFASLLGQTVSAPSNGDDPGTGLVTSNVNDTPIYVGFGHVIVKLVDNVRKYKIEFFPKVQFKPFVTSSKTKADTLEFTTPSVEATIFQNLNGDWEKHNTFTTEAGAYTALDALFTPTTTP
ncbi:hypothetical protein FACS189465_2550 [Clostridia bacterium]|uniref:Major tail protein n=1 Tax=Candidatus Paraimprobicoccus trichonymphae TaxID=3033793 RepID=A0AA48I071_9FIRM|nr:MAG: putative major tail protein [Candidatus Paraimprobicoccus trichonymphae]GHV24756.1 hypothetical protein FACS189465_2240 [Clostridia bacterium]GHV24931.1 hypothetical protein FACS189465_2550 [Clostridia bacterium]